jgi:hypothetical protein
VTLSDANGVAQVCFIGVINPQNPRVESPEEVRDALMEASKHIPKERLGSTDGRGRMDKRALRVRPRRNQYHFWKSCRSTARITAPNRTDQTKHRREHKSR